MKTKRVIAAKHPVPMEANGRRYIDQTPTVVSLTSYYVRRLMAGELIDLDAPVPVPPPAPAPLFQPEVEPEAPAPASSAPAVPVSAPPDEEN